MSWSTAAMRSRFTAMSYEPRRPDPGSTTSPPFTNRSNGMPSPHKVSGDRLRILLSLALERFRDPVQVAEAHETIVIKLDPIRAELVKERQLLRKLRRRLAVRGHRPESDRELGRGSRRG